MAIKKSELYSSLWQSCDELRAAWMQVSTRTTCWCCCSSSTSATSTRQPYAPITIPKGASFKDMVALKGKSDIGDKINKQIIGPLANANKLSDMPDFMTLPSS